MHQRELRYLAKNQPLWQWAAKRPRSAWGPDLRQAEADGLVEVREGAFWITAKGVDVATKTTCPHCGKPLSQ